MHAFDARADDRSSASRILYAPFLKTALDCSRRACRAAADTRTHTVRHPNAGRAPRGRLEPVPVPAPARVAPKVWWTRASSSRARHTRDGRSRDSTRARATRRRAKARAALSVSTWARDATGRRTPRRWKSRVCRRADGRRRAVTAPRGSRERWSEERMREDGRRRGRRAGGRARPRRRCGRTRRRRMCSRARRWTRRTTRIWRATRRSGSASRDG